MVKNMKWKYVIISLIIIFVLVICAYIFIPPKITIMNDKINIGSKYYDNFQVTRFSVDYTDKTKTSEKIKNNKIGSYPITFRTEIGFRVFTQTKTIQIADIEYPVIALKGNTKSYVCPNTEYKDEGATAMDNLDGDITKKIKVSAEENKVIYSVKDKAGNLTKRVRKLVYKDVTAPVISLNGDKDIFVYTNEKFVDPGATAKDNCDGDITKKIIAEGQIDTSKVGTYTIIYSVSDKYENKATIQRNVKVINRPVANGTGKAGAIYLTFDDGPNEGTTNVILDILKAEGVKATFFVTKNGPDYLIKREHDEGHTVALHTWSHNYQTCYSSVEGYFADLKLVSDRVKRITGIESKIIRFPGGASNTVSRNYKQGIMSTLTKEVENRGYSYFDWNISSGDAGGTTDPKGVYANVVNNLSKSRANIVLMHDIKRYTRDAIKDIIVYGKQNGYTFDRITENTVPYHQKANN